MINKCETFPLDLYLIHPENNFCRWRIESWTFFFFFWQKTSSWTGFLLPFPSWNSASQQQSSFCTWLLRNPGCRPVLKNRKELNGSGCCTSECLCGFSAALRSSGLCFPKNCSSVSVGPDERLRMSTKFNNIFRPSLELTRGCGFLVSVFVKPSGSQTEA